MSHFKHSSNARNNEKLLALRIKYGWLGYGLYWAIVEKLREASGYKLSTDYRLVAYELAVDTGLIGSIVNDFGLFVVDDNYFYSEILSESMELKMARSRKASESAKARWASMGNGSQNNEQGKNEKTANVEKPFVPPTQKEVEAYCAERKNDIDASLFINFYEARGWMAGRSKMKNWQAAIKMWELNKKRTKTNNDLQDASTRIHPALQ